MFKTVVEFILATGNVWCSLNVGFPIILKKVEWSVVRLYWFLNYRCIVLWYHGVFMNKIFCPFCYATLYTRHIVYGQMTTISIHSEWMNYYMWIGRRQGNEVGMHFTKVFGNKQWLYEYSFVHLDIHHGFSKLNASDEIA